MVSGGPTGNRPFVRLGRILARENNNGNTGEIGLEPGLDVETRHLGHVQIEYGTVGTMNFQRPKELGAVGENLHAKSRRTQEPLKCFAHRFFVVNDRNEGSGIGHRPRGYATPAPHEYCTLV